MEASSLDRTTPHDPSHTPPEPGRPKSPVEPAHAPRKRESRNDKGSEKRQGGQQDGQKRSNQKKKGGKKHNEDNAGFDPQVSISDDNDEWGMYYDKPESTGQVTQEAFEGNLNRLGTFNNMAQFWERFGDMGFQNLPTLASMRAFRKGITPSWEHPANHKGGKWIVVVPKTMSVGVFNEVLAAVVSGKVGDVANGVLLAKKRREDLVNVWTAAAPEEELEAVKEAIVERLAKNLGIEADISFKAHHSKKAHKSAKGFGIERADLPPTEPELPPADGDSAPAVPSSDPAEELSNEKKQDDTGTAADTGEEQSGDDNKGYLRSAAGWLFSKFK